MLHGLMIGAAAFVFYAVRWSNWASAEAETAHTHHLPIPSPPTPTWSMYSASDADVLFGTDGQDEIDRTRTDPHPDIPQGREEAVADSEMGGVGGFMCTSSSGGAAGMFGVGPLSSASARPWRYDFHAGNARREEVLQHAIAWLIEAQRDDGTWTTDGNRDHDLPADPLATALALYCFQRARFDTNPAFRPVDRAMQRGLRALIAGQEDDGGLAPWPAHPIATTVLMVEAWHDGLEPHAIAARRALAQILARQEPDLAHEAGLLGWRRRPEEATLDAWTTMWCTIALHTALTCDQLQDRTAFDGVLAWMRRGMDDAPERAAAMPLLRIAAFPLTWSEAGGSDLGERRLGVPGVGAVTAMHCGNPYDVDPIGSLTNAVGDDVVATVGEDDPAICWANTLALWYADDAPWLVWREILTQRLWRRQCLDGAWEAQPTIAGSDGRVATTALYAMALATVHGDHLFLDAMRRRD